MLVAYLDEFGHIGPYVSHDHQRHHTHPAFGYGGFVMPVEGVRPFGGLFEYLKARLFEPEILRDGAHPKQWEKKGSSLFTTRNHVNYGDEIRPALRRLSRKLHSVDGQIVYYGQEKPVGDELATGESAANRSQHMLINSVRHLCKYADKRRERIMIFLDAVDSKPRLEAVRAMGGFIYGDDDPALKRVIEVPMQLESKHYGMVQYADWVCGLIGRTSHFHLVPGSEFSWAPRVLRDDMLRVASAHTASYIQRRRDLGDGWKSLKPGVLKDDRPWHGASPRKHRYAPPRS